MIDYAQLKIDVANLIQDLGVGSKATIAHAAGTTSKGFVVISTTNITVTDQAHVSRIVGTELTGFLEDIKTAPCPGDVLTANNIDYKIREVAAYNPSGRDNVAYKVTLDA